MSNAPHPDLSYECSDLDVLVTTTGELEIWSVSSDGCLALLAMPPDEARDLIAKLQAGLEELSGASAGGEELAG
jgi:hypothetical protein